MVWTLNAIKVTAFALERPALQQRKVSPMRRFALLASGNLMLLSFTLRILPCQLSNFYSTSLGQLWTTKHIFTMLFKLFATL